MCRANLPAPTRNNGFTLIEVLIALAILSIALAAAMRATAMATTSAEEVKLRTYATWIAQNRAAELTARRVFPGVGVENGQTEMAGINFRWSATTNETPNTAFRKVEIAVTRTTAAAATADERKLAVLTVYLARPVNQPKQGAT
ncbi:MAG: type II secretion system minor pseudopilin GspI [Burkholderiales bacterium]|nr:type II secretion system minor pseudopilin GspI [Rhodocyclaceae bacterium]